MHSEIIFIFVIRTQATKTISVFIQKFRKLNKQIQKFVIHKKKTHKHCKTCQKNIFNQQIHILESNLY